MKSLVSSKWLVVSGLKILLIGLIGGIGVQTLISCSSDDSEGNSDSSSSVETSSSSENASSSSSVLQSSSSSLSEDYECTLGQTLIYFNGSPVQPPMNCTQTEGTNCLPIPSAEVCIKSCEPSPLDVVGAKNIIVDECGAQIANRLEWYLDNGIRKKEILSVDHEHCGMFLGTGRLGCYGGIINIDEQNAKVLVFNGSDIPNDIDANFFVGIKGENKSKLITSFYSKPKLIKNENEEICVEEWLLVDCAPPYCPIAEDVFCGTFDCVSEKAQLCRNEIYPPLEYYINDDKLDFDDSEQCTRINSPTGLPYGYVCYGGFFITVYNRVSLDYGALTHPCKSMSSAECSFLVKYGEAEPLVLEAPLVMDY